MTYTQPFIFDTTHGVFDAFSLTGLQKLFCFFVNDWGIDLIADYLSAVCFACTLATSLDKFSPPAFNQLNSLTHQLKHAGVSPYKQGRVIRSRIDKEPYSQANYYYPIDKRNSGPLSTHLYEAWW